MTRPEPKGYEPKVGDMATITLPGEITRGEIARVINPKAIIVQLKTFTTSKDHNYRRGDHVPCKLVTGPLNQLIWLAIDERDLKDSAERAEKVAEQSGLAAPLPPREPDEGVCVLGEN